MSEDNREQPNRARVKWRVREITRTRVLRTRVTHYNDRDHTSESKSESESETENETEQQREREKQQQVE